METQAVKRRNLAFLVVTCVFGLALVVLGLMSPDGRTRFFYVLGGLPLLLAALIGVGRVASAPDVTRLAVATIQHNWITLSLALAFLSLVPAEFFLTALPLRATAGALTGLLVVFSAVLLLNVKRVTGVDLSI